ncbi:MAG: hypothetical protein WD055_02695 [Candidatus Dependentiae bacterium]
MIKNIKNIVFLSLIMCMVTPLDAAEAKNIDQAEQDKVITLIQNIFEKDKRSELQLAYTRILSRVSAVQMLTGLICAWGTMLSVLMFIKMNSELKSMNKVLKTLV